MTSPFPKTIELVKALGIDPQDISVYDIDVNGYSECQRDERGNILREEDGGPVLVHREWPSLKDAVAIVDCFMRENGYDLIKHDQLIVPEGGGW